MKWSVVSIGKYAGKNKTLPQIAFDDPDWFFWAVEKGACRGPLADEAVRVAARARRIRAPQPDGQLWVVEYTLRERDGKFAVMELVPATRALHARSVRRVWIDLGYPRSVCRYDKFGSKQIARQVKGILFGSESVRMTRARAEAFFADEANFELP